MASESKTLASLPGDFCIKTVEHSGNPRGTIISIGGMETYITRPPKEYSASSNIIFFFADVYGPLYINSKLLMDYLASYGYIVLGPDYFEGDPVHLHNDDPNFNRSEWIQSKYKRARELLPPWIEAVKLQYGTSQTQYAAVGYCFGAPSVMYCATQDWLAAAALAHPAMLDESHFKALKTPLLLSCAEIDHTFPTASRHRAEIILAELKANYHIQVFSGVAHGFAVRGDPADPVQKWAKEESANTVLKWFNRYCEQRNETVTYSSL